MPARVLIADGDLGFAQFLEHALRLDGYEVRIAGDADSARMWAESFEPEVLISEISLPGAEAFGVVEHCLQLNPKLLCAILTDEDVDRHLDAFHTYQIAHVYTKGIPFHSNEFLVRLRQSIVGDIFGFEAFLDEPLQHFDWNLRSPTDIELVTETVINICQLGERDKHLRMVLGEVLTNALFYGARNEKGEDKLDWDRDFELPAETSIQLRLAIDQAHIALSITDPGGRLDRDTLLYWLKRQTPPASGGLPEGILDTHGRGLFITRQLMDRVFFNIEKGVRSECLLLLFKESRPTPYKPLSILEI
jgi:CheY-like chemotaxis protein